MEEDEDGGGPLSLDRIRGFSDGVFGFAITLLVLGIDVPINIPRAKIASQLPRDLVDLWPHLLSFLISFFVIGLYWVVHNRVFGRIKRADSTLVWINLLFLMFIVLVPFAQKLVGEYGDRTIAVAVYASILAALGYVSTLMWWYASNHHRLVDPALSPRLIRAYFWRGVIPPTVFLASIPLAFLSPTVAEISWGSLPIIGRVVDRLTGRSFLTDRSTEPIGH